MFGLGSDVMSLQEMISDVPAESANTALYDSAMKMFQSALEDAQPHLRRISLIYNQVNYYSFENIKNDRLPNSSVLFFRWSMNRCTT